MPDHDQHRPSLSSTYRVSLAFPVSALKYLPVLCVLGSMLTHYSNHRRLTELQNWSSDKTNTDTAARLRTDEALAWPYAINERRREANETGRDPRLLGEQQGPDAAD